MTLPGLTIPVFWATKARAYPTHAKGAAAAYRPLCEVLTRPFDTDAHFAVYACPSIPRRLDSDAPAVVPDGIPLVLAVFDIDDPVSHKLKAPARAEWHTWEHGKIASMLVSHPGLFLYVTRGGYRIVGQLPAPFVVHRRADAEAWSNLYRRWCGYLKRCFQIVPDAACADWTRLYRVPRATRDGVLQALGAMGDAANVGLWAPELTDADVGPARGRPRKAREPHIVLQPDGMPDESALPSLEERVSLARVWAARMPPSMQDGQGGRACFNVFTGLIRGWCLPPEIARQIFDADFNTRCVPPWTDEDEITHKIASACDAEQPWGYVLHDHLETRKMQEAVDESRAQFWEEYAKKGT